MFISRGKSHVCVFDDRSDGYIWLDSGGCFCMMVMLLV